MEWLKKSEINPEKTQRIIVCSNKNGKIHVLHWDYEDWILSETDDDFPGESVDFDFWMPVPNQPERSKREDFCEHELFPEEFKEGDSVYIYRKCKKCADKLYVTCL